MVRSMIVALAGESSGCQLFAANLVDGAYFAMPLRSAAVQLHRRLNDWLARTFGTASPPIP